MIVGTSAGNQIGPSAARLADGTSAIAWLSNETGTPWLRVHRYDDAGEAVGGEPVLIMTNSQAANAPNIVSRLENASIVATSTGFALAWCSFTDRGRDTSSRPNPGWDSFAQRVNFDGTLDGPSYKLNASPTHYCSRPLMAALPSGAIAVTQALWTPALGLPGYQPGACTMQMLGRSGLGPQVGLGESSDCTPATLANGGFVVAVQETAYIRGDSVVLYRFDAQGARVGDKHYIDGSMGVALVPDSASGTAVTGLPDGNVALAWNAKDAQGLVMQRFTPDGVAAGPRTVVDTGSPSSYMPAAGAKIAANPDGAVAVVWNVPNRVNQTDTKAQSFDAQGNPRGPVRFLGFSSTQLLSDPGHWVAPSSEGRFVYGWQQVQDPNGASIRMSRE